MGPAGAVALMAPQPAPERLGACTTGGFPFPVTVPRLARALISVT